MHVCALQRERGGGGEGEGGGKHGDSGHLNVGQGFEVAVSVNVRRLHHRGQPRLLRRRPRPHGNPVGNPVAVLVLLVETVEGRLAVLLGRVPLFAFCRFQRRVFEKRNGRQLGRGQAVQRLGLCVRP